MIKAMASGEPVDLMSDRHRPDFTEFRDTLLAGLASSLGATFEQVSAEYDRMTESEVRATLAVVMGRKAYANLFDRLQVAADREMMRLVRMGAALHMGHINNGIIPPPIDVGYVYKSADLNRLVAARRIYQHKRRADGQWTYRIVKGVA